MPSIRKLSIRVCAREAANIKVFRNGKVPAVGITHPNLEGQADVIRHAYRRGGDLDPRLTGYFECHGTGTAVGDPLEVHAVAKAMNENRLPGQEPLLIGAVSTVSKTSVRQTLSREKVKTNIGHSEAASGLSAVIKAVLTVEKGIIPPTRGVVNPSRASKSNMPFPSYFDVF